MWGGGGSPQAPLRDDSPLRQPPAASATSPSRGGKTTFLQRLACAYLPRWPAWTSRPRPATVVAKRRLSRPRRHTRCRKATVLRARRQFRQQSDAREREKRRKRQFSPRTLSDVSTSWGPAPHGHCEHWEHSRGKARLASRVGGAQPAGWAIRQFPPGAKTTSSSEGANAHWPGSTGSPSTVAVPSRGITSRQPR